MSNLFKYFKGYRLPSLLGPLFKLFEALLELWVPFLVALIIDHAIMQKDTHLLRKYLLALFAIAAVGLLFANTAQYFSAKAAVGFSKNITEDLYKHVIRLSKADQTAFNPSSLITRLSSDTFQVQTGLNIFYRLFLRSPFIVIGALVMALRIDVRISLWFLGLIVILSLIIWGLSKLSTPAIQRVRRSFDRLVSATREQIQGVRVIKAFNQEAREIASFETINDTLTDGQIKTAIITAFNNPLTYLIVNVILVCVIWQGGGDVYTGRLTQGQLVALINYLLSILIELSKLAMVIGRMNRSLISAKRLSVVLSRPEEASTFASEAVEGDALLEVDHVSFKYPGARSYALQDIHFTIQQGEMIGIIGATGSGKTTLFDLLTRTYDPTEGYINYNSNSMNVTSRSTLRDDISVVPASASLFKGTIRSNLLNGKRDASVEEMWQALQDSQALEFVEKLEQGLDHKVETFGRNFSGGQRQRLTIARALIKPAPLLIFDDSTSALDYLTESRFQGALTEYYSDRTIIMISQRVHSLRHADKILVLDKGRQVAFGSHDTLMEISSLYREIYESQAVKEA